MLLVYDNEQGLHSLTELSSNSKHWFTTSCRKVPESDARSVNSVLSPKEPENAAPMKTDGDD